MLRTDDLQHALEQEGYSVLQRTIPRGNACDDDRLDVHVAGRDFHIGGLEHRDPDKQPYVRVPIVNTNTENQNQTTRTWTLSTTDDAVELFNWLDREFDESDERLQYDSFDDPLIDDDIKEFADVINGGNRDSLPRAVPHQRGAYLYLHEGGFGFGYFPKEKDGTRFNKLGNIRAYYDFRVTDSFAMSHLPDDHRHHRSDASFFLNCVFWRFLEERQEDAESVEKGETAKV